MATKDITDIQVLKAYAQSWIEEHQRYPYEILEIETGQPFKVCYRAMERADKRGLIDWGITLRSGWITDKGVRLLAEYSEFQDTKQLMTEYMRRINHE